ncbi:MAG: phosphoglucosamine mutase [Saprospiraceae bacterium]|nr:phosphoglucosamine mutase [Saprospiraceae bacterium]
MSLIKSISGIRGTIGGKTGDNFTPIDIVACCAGYGTWLKQSNGSAKVVIGRDARISGPMVHELAVQTLIGLGIDVIDLDLSTTPTVEMAVVFAKAQGGIIITASHNPEEWNALKFLNSRGEFISAEDGEDILTIIDAQDYDFAQVDRLGVRTYDKTAIARHIEAIMALALVEVKLVRNQKLKIAVDCVNSTGSISIAPLLDALGCEYQLINNDLSGRFSHNPEPLPEHLTALSNMMIEGNFDLGIAVDPDVDRLVFVCEDGSMFGEEYTIVTLADYILQYEGGATVSNLSSTQALKDVTIRHGYEYHAAAVGEVNVVAKMKAVKAAFGGEGNGGVIYPKLHYGRDALVGIAMMLSHLVKSKTTMSQIRFGLPEYTISKKKVALEKGLNPDEILQKLMLKYQDTEQNREDGLKLIFNGEWVHMRKSNTEPIIRIYAESATPVKADDLANRFLEEINLLSKVID